MSRYHISDRDEGHDNDDDEGGSKSFPSRESWGAAWSIGEKHPTLTEPLILFFGLWRIPMWGYLWGYTIAQIELLAIDSPMIAYNRKKKKGKSNSQYNKPQVKMEDVEAKVRQWKDKYENNDNPVVIDLSGYN